MTRQGNTEEVSVRPIPYSTSDTDKGIKGKMMETTDNFHIDIHKVGSVVELNTDEDNFVDYIILTTESVNFQVCQCDESDCW